MNNMNSKRIFAILCISSLFLLNSCDSLNLFSSSGGSNTLVEEPAPELTIKILRDYSFARNRIFDLAYTGDALGYPDQFQPGDKIIKLEIYYDNSYYYDGSSDSGWHAHFYVDPNDTSKFSNEQQLIRRFRKYDLSMYTWGEVHNETGIPYVVFSKSVSENIVLAFYMEFESSIDGDTIKVGDISQEREGDSLYLKLLYPGASKSYPTNQTWQLMWRNTYNMPRDVDFEDMDIRIFRGLAGTEATFIENLDVQYGSTSSPKYIQVLGLDQYNVINASIPDGRVDARLDIYRSDWGLLIFPDRVPFNSSKSFSGFDALLHKVPELYNTKPTDRKFVTSSEYYFQITTY